MLSKNLLSPVNSIISLLFIGFLGSQSAQAQTIQCDSTHAGAQYVSICQSALRELRNEMNERFLTTYLVTDAPTKLVLDTQSLWFNRLMECKSKECRSQQLNARIDDLNFYMSMNQTLTQHYLKYEQGKLQPVHIKVHQLGKDRIKIEGLVYRNPNNRPENQVIPLLAYTTPDKKDSIVDNEHDCKYQLNFQKALLVVSTQQKGCERFNGIYRLYD